jgi:hypothetical protein
VKYLCLSLFVLSMSFATAKPVDFENGNITLEAPADFTFLTQEELDKKFPSKHGPSAVIGNDSRAVTIAYQLSEQSLQPDQLTDAQHGMTPVLNRVIPGIQWIKNDIVEINGVKWIYFEFTSNAAQGEIHNIEIATSYNGKMAIINLNADTKDFDSFQDKLKESLNSVKIKSSP